MLSQFCFGEIKATDTDRSVNESTDLLVTVATDTDRSVNEPTDLLVTVATDPLIDLSM